VGALAPCQYGWLLGTVERPHIRIKPLRISYRRTAENLTLGSSLDALCSVISPGGPFPGRS
jgi:hypothetical protein